MSRIPQILFAILLIVCDCAVAGSPMEDFDAAKQQAKRERKDVILSFSGYRWWWPTIGMDTDTKDPWIREHFVMLEIPLNSAASGGNASPADQELVDLRKRFDQDLVKPGSAIFLLDASGRPYAELSSDEQPAEIYIPDLKAAQIRRAKRDAAFEQARKVKGLKKARLLNNGLRALCDDEEYGCDVLLFRNYQDILAEIIRNDPKDVLGRAEDLKEQNLFELDGRKDAEAQDQLKKLAGDLNRMLDAGSPLAAISSAIEKFLLSHPELPDYRRQQALSGKVQAALILRDYVSAQKTLTEVVAVSPDSELGKTFISTLRPEIEKADKLFASGVDNSATTYAIHFEAFGAELLDADGTRTRDGLKELDLAGDALLTEDLMSFRLLPKIEILLRLRDYEQALKVLNEFVGLGGATDLVMRHDRELRPIILKGLNKKRPGEGEPPKAEQ